MTLAEAPVKKIAPEPNFNIRLAAIAARDVDRLEKAANEIRELPNQGNKVIAIPADITQAEDIENLVSKTLATFGQMQNRSKPFL